jgi:hypothetical protein
MKRKKTVGSVDKKCKISFFGKKMDRKETGKIEMERQLLRANYFR